MKNNCIAISSNDLKKSLPDVACNSAENNFFVFWGAAPGDDHTAWINAETAGYGADLGMICAASESSAPIQLAAELCRLKGRVVCVGATAMDLDRRSACPGSGLVTLNPGSCTPNFAALPDRLA